VGNNSLATSVIQVEIAEQCRGVTAVRRWLIMGLVLVLIGTLFAGRSERKPVSSGFPAPVAAALKQARLRGPGQTWRAYLDTSRGRPLWVVQNILRNGQSTTRIEFDAETGAQTREIEWLPVRPWPSGPARIPLL